MSEPRAEIVVTPQVLNQGTVIVAIAGEIKVTISTDSRPAGTVAIEVQIAPENASTSTIAYRLSFRDGQSYTFTHGWDLDVVTGTLAASGPGLQFELSASTEGTGASESGTL